MKTMNDARIAKAKRALKEYVDAGDVCIQDLLADLMHYCDKNNIEFKHRLGSALDHYKVESGRIPQWEIIWIQ